ncbi:MAG: phage Gp37/Gp68 family protein, partial [Bacteroidales bacterium]|nr:phage Gp37/Gp68 family protein [Bacteroidales bacterium]
NDCTFYFFTKRISRLPTVIPDDWGDGYDNVIIGCTAENQEMADIRLPIFAELPIKHKTIILAPLLGPMDISKYLTKDIEEVSVGGESGAEARICRYDWILDIRRQCIEHNIPFRFHQTGATFIKDGKLYRIMRGHQLDQAAKAGINFRIGPDMKPY